MIIPNKMEIAFYTGKRNITQLSSVEIEHILQDAPTHCYYEIADELDIPMNTVKKVVRQHNYARLKRYK